MNSPTINARASSIRPSATLSISARAKALRAAGERVLDFAAGQPDFAPPKAIGEALAGRVASEAIGYAPVPGLPALRDRVAHLQSELHGREFTRNEILVSCGAKHSLANLFLVTLEAGDEVVFPAPYWVSYPEMVRLAGGESKIVQSERANGYKMRPEQLAAALGPATRFVLLNSPSNPSGVAYDEAELAALGAVIAERAPQAWLVVDDIYRTLVYDDFVAPSAIRAVGPLAERVIVIDGVSKSHAMTGYRIGFLIAPQPVIQAVQAVQGQMTSGAATPSQWAALTALDESLCGAEVDRMRAAFAARRTLMCDGLRALSGFDFVEPNGAFYVFPDISAHLGGRHTSDVDLCAWLLEEHLLATVPGSAFGSPGHLRLSFATDEGSIREGLDRLSAAFG
jgi:aspartate aminotransferase